jgi:hypothetical protein
MAPVRWLVLGLVALVAACTPVPILVVNPHAGLEGTGERMLRMRFARLAPEETTAKAQPPAATLVYRLGDPGEDGYALAVLLPFTARNAGDTPWPLGSRAFTLARPDGAPPLRPAHADFPILTLAPRSHARFELPVRFEAPRDRAAELMCCVYRLQVVADEEALLVKELSLAKVSQPTDLGRMAALFVATIGLIGLL